MSSHKELILSNAHIVRQHDVVMGTLQVRYGKIAAIDTGFSQLPQAQDCEGDYLLPGLVELHTDNLEKHMKPRPGVSWPALPAVVAHDAQLIAAGITTVLDAIALGEVREDTQRVALLDSMMEALSTARQQQLLRADHKLHLRCEVVYPHLLAMWERFRDHPAVQLVSLMDHSPGQRQFVNLAKYYEYYQGKYGLSDADMDAFMAQQSINAACYGVKHREAVANYCRQQQIVMASHDDATDAHVRESVEAGAGVAEFPTTREAAQASRQQGMPIIMGAPNVMRGYSHSGNVSARELAAVGLIDILSSDYIPNSLLLAVFKLVALFESISLPQAVSWVSRQPAQAIGLQDRGELNIGLRADIVRVRPLEDLPLVLNVWQCGERVY